MLKKTFVVVLILTFCFQGFPVFGQTQTERGVGVRMKNELTGNFENVTLYQKSYALVIGESRYKFTSAWKELEGVRQDVPAIAKLLRERGFDEVVVAQDLTRAQLDQTIRGFISKYGLVRENRLLIYYAGHGYTETTEDGLKLGYIVPIDAPSPVRQPDVFYETAMSMNDIESYALSIRSKHVLFVFDSCFSGTILRKTRSTVPPIITLKAAEPVRQFITSGAEDQEVPDVSEFRKQFEEGVRGEADLNNDGYVTGSELGDFLQEKVTNYSRGSQTPLTGKIANGALDKGDFIFILKKNIVVQPVQNNTNPPNGETAFWNSIENSTDIEDFENYLARVSSGDFAGIYRATAELKLARLKKANLAAAWNKIRPTARLLLKYDFIGQFSEGLAEAKLNGKAGFVDKSGKEVIPLIKYDMVESFSEGLAQVRLIDKWGLIDKNGKEITPLKYGVIWSFSEGLAQVYLDGDKGFIDKSGKEVIPPKYDDVESFSEGLAVVKLNGKYGFIDKSDKEVIPLKYDEVKSFSEGLAWVNLNGKYALIDKSGKEVVALDYYRDVYPFSEGLAQVVLNDKWGFIDKSGKEVIPLKYDFVGSFFKGFAWVNLKDKWGFIDKSGKEVIPIKYDSVGRFLEGLAWVELNGKAGFIDKIGKEVVPLKYDDVWCHAFKKEGFIGVTLNGKKGFVDLYGNEYFDF